MKPEQAALHAALEDIFRSFAYLELQARDEEADRSIEFHVCAEVSLGEPEEGAVAVFLTAEAAAMVSDHFIGGQSTDSDQDDVVRELANVIAGSVCSLVPQAPRRKLGIPRLVPKDQVQSQWERSLRPQRLVLADEEKVYAGVVLNSREGRAGAS
ncbi:MAG TPA: hypothetical protein VGP72_22810 [Planctomycetota bacterium]|jgi:hypothetical protein